MVVPCAILCLLAIISFGSFATEHDKIRKAVEKNNKGVVDPRYCILFIDAAGDGLILSEDHTCVFAIWGEVAICFLAIVLGVFFTVKALIGVHALTWFSVVELVTMALTGLFNFTVAIVISAGLDNTCDAFEDSTGKSIQCSGYELIPGPRNTTKTRISFYDNINAARTTAWVGTVLLVILTAVYIILLCTYCYRLKHKPERMGYEQHRHYSSTSVAGDQKDEHDEAVPV